MAEEKIKHFLPVPENEQERLKHLETYNILDTLPEEEYDAITRLASYICQSPIALISLLDVNRQWFKSKIGLEVEETHRNISFCQYAIMDDALFEIPDAHLDKRFRNNPLVTGKPYIRFYAGAPLIMPDGHKFGTLCVIDTKPKNLTPEQLEALQTLAKAVVSQIILRKQNTTLGIEKQRALQSLQAKEQFLANMSHEIRTPINGISGLTNLLLTTLLNDEQKEYLQHIKNCTENLTVIINDILDYSKIESGKLKFETIAFSIRQVCDSAVALFKVKAEEKGLQLEMVYFNNIPEALIGDPFRLSQVINNLLSNAIKFTEAGKVIFSVACHFQSEISASLLFTIQDTGIGIPEGKLSVIFESFTQANNDTSRKYGGTGLGPAITKKLVEEQGGQIWVTSKLGEGSCFQVNLDFKIEIQSMTYHNSGQVTTKAKQEKNIKVLIVEDNLVNQLIAVKVIKNKGFETDVAEDGKVAIEKIQSNEYDIVLMDIQMPEMDGYEAIRFIRNQIAPKKNIPIIALTAHAIKEEIEKCYNAGANDYISKPYKPEELISKIENLVAFL